MSENSLILLLAILPLILMLWTLIDIIQLTVKEKVHIKLFWILLILMLPILGSILYWQLGRPSAKNHKRVFRPDFNRTVRKSSL